MTLEFLRKERLDTHTTFRMGGGAKAFVVCTSVAELHDAYLRAKEEKLETMILGGGSNILVGKDGWDGLVIKMGIPGVTYHAENESVVVVPVAARVQSDSKVRR